MLRMIQSSSAAQAKNYYTQSLSKADYYIHDAAELPGYFGGKIADRLGITGNVNKATFYQLCDNINPETGESLTPITRENRRIGYDLTFSASKSVSILHALSHDDHLLKAFEESVDLTLKEIEADAMTRVRKGGQNEDRKTGELLWASFTHQTARAVPGAAADPQLHRHCFLINCSYDDFEEQYKAGQFGNIKSDMPFYQARFNKRFSDNLIDLGYEIRQTDKSFEIAGVPDSIIRHFSKRKNQVEKFAKDHGIAEPKALSEVGARTRSKKQPGLTMTELKKEWRRQISEIKISESDQTAPLRYNNKSKETSLVAKDMVDYTVAHSFERASVMQDRRLLGYAYHHAIGQRSITMDDIDTNFKDDIRIIHVPDSYRTLCTTHENLVEEKYMIALARQGQDKFRPLYCNAPDIRLIGQQGAAIEHVLTTPHQVSIVMGAAGSGKTTLMTEAREHINKVGKEMVVFAPTSEAARNVLVAEGFENAETVAKLLTSKELQNSLKGQVIWIDEAGLLCNKDMINLLQIAEQQNARIVYGGDSRQHAAIQRGDSLRLLNVVGKIEAAEVNKIRRQIDVKYRMAVEDLAKGNIKSGFAKLDQMGAIKEIDPLKPNKELIEDYVQASKSKKSVLVVSPTREQGKAVTAEIRQELKAAGLLGHKEFSVLRLENLNYTEAQKGDARRYQLGQIIQFNQNVPQIKRGSLWRVDSSDKDDVVITDGKKRLSLPIDRQEAFEIYEQKELRLVKGDKVKISRNGFDKDDRRLNNGQALEVAAIKKNGYIVLQNQHSKCRYTINQDFGHIDHAYCTTSYSSQGKTSDIVLISQPSGTFTASNAKQFYVSVSRGRENCVIYTDEKEVLLEYASRLGDRQSAIELVGPANRHINNLLQLDREQHAVIKPEKYIASSPFISQQIDLEYEP